MDGFGTYCTYLHDWLPAELTHLIDAITTNKTDFFREAAHFEVLTHHVVPALMAEGIGVQRPLRVWSAGCSSGPEPYTLAMVLSDYAARHPMAFHITGTDVCTEVLETARAGIYPEAMVDPIPLPLRKRYLLRSRDPGAALVRIAPEVRDAVTFRPLNFMDSVYDLPERQDVIFCRNVIIYFDHERQQRVLERLCRTLHPGGFLFMGHAETLTDFTLPLHPVAPMVYRKT